MKKPLQIAITLFQLALVFILPNSAWANPSPAVTRPSFSEYFGDLLFASQAELDAFPSEFTVINGTITVTGSDITSLARLSNITEIDGSLNITGNALLTNVDGLENLNSIVGSLVLDSNPLLSDLSGINHLMFVSQSLIITNNPALGTCAVESICFYLSNPIASRTARVLGVNISDNGPGCTSIEQVMANCATLPVTLVSFDAKKVESKVLLQWKTAEEENSAKFDIQRSADGKNWVSIGIVNAAGQANTEISYSFDDAAPFAGDNLYRLKMIDLDGAFTFSSMRNVWMDAQVSIGAITYPNPSNDFVCIQLQDWSQVKEVQIADLKGRTVLVSGEKAGDHISVKNLTQGIYVLRVKMLNGIVLTHKMVKQ